MNRYSQRGPNVGGPSKATPTTLCQKCLQRDNYECKAIAQERPYVSRPSRTQQLANPKLVPKLTSDVPQELLRKKGIADEQLAKKELERGRKRDRQDDSPERTSVSKRMRSASSGSSISVATISTGASVSPRHALSSGAPRESAHDSSGHIELKRRRSSSERSYSSDSEPVRAESRSTRRRISELSPLGRGRQRDRKTPVDSSSHFSGGRSGSRESYAKGRGRRSGKSPSKSHDREHGRQGGLVEGGRGEVRNYDGEANEGRRGGLRHRDRSTSSDQLQRKRYSDVDERYGATVRNNENAAAGYQRPTQVRGPPRERSLSPFSKRLALTKSMNNGR